MATTDFSKTLTEKKTVYGKSNSSFKPCGGCPSPSKCRAAKKCMGKTASRSDRRKNRGSRTM